MSMMCRAISAKALFAGDVESVERLVGGGGGGGAAAQLGETAAQTAAAASAAASGIELDGDDDSDVGGGATVHKPHAPQSFCTCGFRHHEFVAGRSIQILPAKL